MTCDGASVAWCTSRVTTVDFMMQQRYVERVYKSVKVCTFP